MNLSDIIINTYQTHTEIITTNTNNTNNTHCTIDIQYDKCLIFFCGYNQMAEKYKSKFIKILQNHIIINNKNKIKVILLHMKKYLPSNQVQFFLDDDSFSKLSEVYSYFKAIMNKEKFFDVKKIIFDADYDIDVLNIILKEYYYLNKNWNNFIFSGFSMGSRYAIHIAELLNCDLFCLIILKTNMFDYDYGTSSFLNEYFNSLKSNTSSANISLYDKEYNNHKSVLSLNNLLNELHRDYYSRGVINDNNNYNNKLSLISKTKVHARYSLNDPITKNDLDKTFDVLVRNFTNLYFSYDYDSKHRVDSGLDLISNKIIELLGY